MKVLTVWQPWASLIAIGVKPFEFRSRQAPVTAINQRIAIHAAKRPVEPAEIQMIIDKIERDGGPCIGLDPEPALRFLEHSLVDPSSMPFSSIICTAFLGRARKSEGTFDIDFVDRWAWPMTNVEELNPMVPARGHQGFWTWNHSSHVGRGARNG